MTRRESSQPGPNLAGILTSSQELRAIPEDTAAVPCFCGLLLEPKQGLTPWSQASGPQTRGTRSPEAGRCGALSWTSGPSLAPQTKPGPEPNCFEGRGNWSHTCLVLQGKAPLHSAGAHWGPYMGHATGLLQGPSRSRADPWHVTASLGPALTKARLTAGAVLGDRGVHPGGRAL